MRVLIYWLARMAIFAAVLSFLWFVVKWQDIIVIIAAFVLAWLIGYLALPGLRAAAAEQMDRWLDRSERGIREADAEEDAEIGGAFTSGSERGSSDCGSSDRDTDGEQAPVDEPDGRSSKE